MRTNRRMAPPIWVTMAGVVLFSCSAMQIVRSSPPLPPGWPEPLRDSLQQATQYETGIPTNQVVYEIPFFERAEFERAWPLILQLKAPGAPLTLIRSSDPRQSGFNKYQNIARVRILTPPRPSPVTIKGGKTLQPGPPWPASILDRNGLPPAFVTATDDGWIAVDPKETKFLFTHRARIDIELVLDGQIIDLNRIPLPPDTPIIDRRELGLTTQPAAQPTTQPSAVTP